MNLISGNTETDREDADDSGIVLTEASIVTRNSPETQIPVIPIPGPEPVILTLPLYEDQRLILDLTKILPFENKALLCQGN